MEARTVNLVPFEREGPMRKYKPKGKKRVRYLLANLAAEALGGESK